MKIAARIDVGLHNSSAQDKISLNVTPTEEYKYPPPVSFTTVAQPSNSVLPVIKYISPTDKLGIPVPPNLNI